LLLAQCFALILKFSLSLVTNFSNGKPFHPYNASKRSPLQPFVNMFALFSCAIIMLNQRQPCLPAYSSTIKMLDPSQSIGLNTSQFQYLEHQFVVALKVLAF
jgi:hypothetical protein